MKHAVVICGQIGSGKSTIARHVASQFGLKLVSFGSYIKHRAERLGRPSTRESLQNLGDSLYETMGSAGLLNAVLTYERIDNDDSVVFDGVRHIKILGEIESASAVTTSVYVKVGQSARYMRYCMREDLFDLSFEAFQVIDSHHVEVGVEELVEHCKFILNAERSKVEVQRNIVNQLTPVLLAKWNDP